MGRQIELKKITKVFGKLTANSEVDFTVESGKIYGLIGENGAGKTTLMRVLYGMYEPDGGEILIERYGTPAFCIGPHPYSDAEHDTWQTHTEKERAPGHEAGGTDGFGYW